MIPQRLTLKNFLSYQAATLDFLGLHTACICGANGAGKSSLLEAIAWAIWGESRAASEDDVIYMGAKEAQVDFIFSSHQQTYRILRSRQRGQTTTLDFQVAQMEEAGSTMTTPSLPSLFQFRSLTAKGIRATQQVILEHLKLDYETFVNSAYLRQGRADEFMLKRPSERKQILADLLKLAQYDELADRAKDHSRQFKGQIDLLARNLDSMHDTLQQQEHVTQEQSHLESQLEALQQQQTADGHTLQQLQQIQHQRQTWQQQRTWQQQQQRTLGQDCQRLQRDLTVAQQQQQQLEAILLQASTIAAGYAHFQTLQAQEESLSAKCKAHQSVQAQRQHYQQQQAQALSEVQAALQQAQIQHDTLLQQQAELHQTLSKSTELEQALTQLQQARTHLNQLDRLQAHVAPLLQRRQQLQSQLDRASTRLSTRLEELHTAAAQLHSQQLPPLQQALLEISDRVETLERQRLYQQRLRDKGLERRSFMERLQAHQRDYETQLAAVEQKIQLLKQEGMDQEIGAGAEPELNVASIEARRMAERPSGLQNSTSQSMPLVAEAPTLYALLPAYPPCPLCDRPLDEHHWTLVLEKHEVEQQEVLQQIWVIREQLAVSEREIQVLRQEYRELDQELAQYGSVLERRGQLQEQVQSTIEAQATRQQLLAEAAEIERTLETSNYAIELHEELRLLDHNLQQLNYDERDHALARGEIDRWRWAEIRQAEMKQAQRRLLQLSQRQPELQAEIAELERALEQLQTETSNHMALLDQQLADIGYSPEQHDELRIALRQAQPWQLHYQELTRSRQQYPSLQQRLQELTQAFHDRHQHYQATQTQIEALAQQLEQTPDPEPQIQALEQQMQQRRSCLDDHLARLGRLQQQQQQLDALKGQYSKLNADLQVAQKQYRVYQELAQAFGKNGIQTLMIENVLPQLETETNLILSRLSANQLHVQFVTQRSNRRDLSHSSKPKAQPSKLIETLDILIADAQGTRPYETYSGGEAFRVNFAIRLALSRLLAQRSGTALQMLIIDEGFGTQDAEGCDRLVAAINAIAPAFACILTVTHVPHFKEAFQARIEVVKTEQGSQLSLSV